MRSRSLPVRFSYPSRELCMQLCTLFVPACVVAWAVLQNGVPVLEHDWWFPRSGGEMAAVAHWYADGWSSFGLGSVQAYPTFYPLAACWWLLGPQPAPLAGLLCCIVASSCIASLAAMSLVPKRALSARFAVSLFAAANPWVCTEYRAGHPYMVFAYAVILSLVAETSQERPRDFVLALLAACSIVQIEFSALVSIPLAVWLWKTRRYRVLLVLAAFLAPVVVGIVAAYGTIHATPFGLDWQRAESIHILDGLRLGGYEFHRAPDDAAHRSLMNLLAASAAIGACAYFRKPFEIALACVAIVLAIFASGLSDFFGFSYAWLVVHVKEIGLFRELFDLIAFVAIAYTLGLAALLQRTRVLAWACVAACCALLGTWLIYPPAADRPKYAVIPQVRIDVTPAQRYLVLPAFQPLRFDAHESGADPDIFGTADGVSALNEWFPIFPVDAALAHAQAGDLRWARALGVVQIIDRPYFTGASMPRVRERTSGRNDTALPLATFIAPSALPARIADRPFEHAEFFGDREPQLISNVEPSLQTHDPAQDWVDARIAVPEYPQEASAFGGIVTTSHVPFVLPSLRSAVLARVVGHLRDDRGRTVAANAATLAWFPLHEDARALICMGRCMIALLGDPPPLPEHISLAADAAEPLVLHRVSAWLAYVALPVRSAGVIRYNTRYDTHWLAMRSNGEVLTHFRLDTALNAWRVHSSDRADTIVLVHTTACAQAILEALAGCVLLGVLVSYGRARLIARDWSSRDRALRRRVR